MPFQRPTLTDLQTQIAADIESRLPGADSQLRRSFLGVLSRAFTGSLHGLYGYLDFTSKQVFPDTAEAEFLDRWAGIWGITRKSAWPASGFVIFIGTNGITIPAGTQIQRGDGLFYQTRSEGTLTNGQVTLEVQAETPGTTGNASLSTTLNLVAPIAGVRSSGRVADDGSGHGLTQGSDEETDAALLARLLLRIRQPPHGGARHDYVGWALDKESHGVDVTRAWDYPQELGLGTVTLRFMMDDSYGDGIPLAADVTAMQAYMDRVRPVTAAVTVAAPIAAPLDFEIAGLDPVSRSVRDAVEAELRDLIRREAKPGGTLLISHIREAISIAAGENDHGLVAPIADVASTTGRIVTFGTVSWS